MNNAIVISRMNGDMTSFINRTLAEAARTDRDVVFEDGVYNVSGRINVPQSVSVYSENLGGAKLRDSSGSAATFRVDDAGQQGGGSISGFIFDNVAVEARGVDGRFTIENNAFVDVRSDNTINVRDGAYTVKNNVLLASEETLEFDNLTKSTASQSDKGSYITGISAQNTRDTIVEGNLVGGLARGKDAASYHDRAILDLAREAADFANVDLYDSGYYSSGAGVGGGSKDSIIRGNSFVGTENGDRLAAAGERFFDHAIYNLKFDGQLIEDNYFTGWPNGSHVGQGGVKIRNGSDLEFRNNVLDNIDLRIYSYNFGNNIDDYLKAENWNIYNNVITSEKRSPIYYSEDYRNNLREGTFVDGLRIFDNVLNYTGEDDGKITLRFNTDGRFSNNSARDIFVDGNVTADGDPVELSVRGASAQTRADSVIRALRDANDQPDAPTPPSRPAPEPDPEPQQPAAPRPAPEPDPEPQQPAAPRPAPRDNDNNGQSANGGNRDDMLSGTSGRDAISGNDGNDQIQGYDGNDTLSGGKGDDFIKGGQGNDVIDAGRQNDLVNGGAGNDQIEGRHGDDTLRGGEGHDYLYGGLGDDKVSGGSGRDILLDGTGEDRLRGGDGADLFRLSDDAEMDRIVDFEVGRDVLDLREWGLNRVNQLEVTQKSGGVLLSYGDEELMVKGVGERQVDDFLDDIVTLRDQAPTINAFDDLV